jgi:hypothetical protein
MQIIQDIKIERLVLALGVTLLVADTVPHPHLSPGLVEHGLRRVQAGLIQESAPAGAIAGLNH